MRLLDPVLLAVARKDELIGGEVLAAALNCGIYVSMPSSNNLVASDTSSLRVEATLLFVSSAARHVSLTGEFKAGPITHQSEVAVRCSHHQYALWRDRAWEP